jgi:hypothetical protein
MVQQHYLILRQLFDQATDSTRTITVARFLMINECFDYFAWFPSPTNLETDFLSVFTTISNSLTISLESHGYDSVNFLFFCARLYLESVARHRWFSDLMHFGSYKIRRSFLSLLETMLRYERQLDKTVYCNMTTSWESRLPPYNNQDTDHLLTPMRPPYEPIPEILLRFIPYQQRNPSPQTPHSVIQVSDRVEPSTMLPDKVDLDSDGAAKISFAEPPDDMWQQQ